MPCAPASARSSHRSRTWSSSARLDPADRLILVMRLAGYPLREIAEALRLPVRTVRDRLAAIVARLEPVLILRGVSDG